MSQRFHLQFVLGNFLPVDADIHEGIRLVVVVPEIDREGRASWQVSVGGAQGPRCWSDGEQKEVGKLTVWTSLHVSLFKVSVSPWSAF